MAVLMSRDNKELIINCGCGCDNSIHIELDDADNDYYCFLTYLNGNYYREQEESVFAVIKKKMRRIWAIIRNKDYCYSDIIMSAQDFEEFKTYINKFGKKDCNAAIKTLREELLKHGKLYDGFMASIRSAIDEMDGFQDTQKVTEYILQRIVGEN